jgi:hypothetical protein
MTQKTVNFQTFNAQPKEKYFFTSSGLYRDLMKYVICLSFYTVPFYQTEKN